jgi:thiamine-phosphate pyrophosphorylase
MPSNFGFYAILTDPKAGYERLTGICVNLGIAFIQLRMKDANAKSVAKTGTAMKKIIEGSKSRLIINDYPQVAADLGAHGVHLGQSDMSYEKAREILGADAIIGLSTHSPEQTAHACKLCPDYIGVGPVFPTPTKKIADPPIGIKGMKAMLEIATVPAVILGAITLDSLPDIISAGARNYSMVRPVNSALEPEAVLKKILEVEREAKNRLKIKPESYPS